MKNVPPSWEKMSRFARACYLVNCKRAKDIPAAMKMLGPVVRRPPPGSLMRQTSEIMRGAGLRPDGKGGVKFWWEKD